MFTQDDITRLYEGYQKTSDASLKLLENYLNFPLKNPQAQEFRNHGLLRRLKTLIRCIENVFQILPPDQTKIPTIDELSDAAINIQAFIFNAFGCLDNLAWIWVKEKLHTEINRKHVGLSNKNITVRKTFSAEFQSYLLSLRDWFEYIENFRHSLAHRIPLYIPPYTIQPNNEEEYQRLEKGKTDAIMRRDFDCYDRLDAKQNLLGIFKPVMIHSFFEDKSQPVVIHSQLLADFFTIEEICLKMLNEF